jgi:hypothetical protein
MWDPDCRLMTHPMCFEAARTRGARVLGQLLTRLRRRCRGARVLLRHAQAAPPPHVEQGPAPLPEPLPGLPRRQELPGVQLLPRSSGRPALARTPLGTASRTSDRPYSTPAVSLEVCTLELSCEATAWPGLVSFVSLLGGFVACLRSPHSTGAGTRPRRNAPWTALSDRRHQRSILHIH